MFSIKGIFEILSSYFNALVNFYAFEGVVRYVRSGAISTTLLQYFAVAVLLALAITKASKEVLDAEKMKKDDNYSTVLGYLDPGWVNILTASAVGTAFFHVILLIFELARGVPNLNSGHWVVSSMNSPVLMPVATM